MKQKSVLFGIPVLLLAGLAGLSAAGCSSSTDSGGTTTTPTMTDAQYQASITSGLQSSIATQLTALHNAAIALQAAAPTTSGRGWDATLDAAAITAMKAAWRQTRVAYEHVEGATAPQYPDSDTNIDARYDDFLGVIGAAGDQDLFDDVGVIGMHAIERILYSDTTPAFVITFEMTIPGYKAAAFPATEQEADEFKNKLLAKLVTDTETLMNEWSGNPVDLGQAYQGLISLMHEQAEKVNNASTGAEESRYSQTTLADIHANLEGSETAYDLFQPWILTKTDASDADKDGPTIDKTITSGFALLQAAYDANTGDAIPQPPATWSAESPSAADLQSPFGLLYTATRTQADLTTKGSVVYEMNDLADIFGFARFTN